MVLTSIGIEIIRSPILPVIKFLYIKRSGLMSNVAGRKRSEIWIISPYLSLTRRRQFVMSVRTPPVEHIIVQDSCQP